MRRRLVASYLVLVAVALVLFTVPVAASSASLLRQTLEETAEREARLFVPLTLRTDAAAATAVTDRTRDFRQATGSVVRLVQAADRDRADAQVQAAFAGRTTSPRWGAAADLDPDVPGRRAVSVVVPAVQDGRVVAVVQVVAPADDVERRIRDIWVFRLGVGGAVLVLAGGLAVLLAGTLVRPLRRLEAVAARHGRGDLSARAPVGARRRSPPWLGPSTTAPPGRAPCWTPSGPSRPTPPTSSGRRSRRCACRSTTCGSRCGTVPPTRPSWRRWTRGSTGWTPSWRG